MGIGKYLYQKMDVEEAVAAVHGEQGRAEDAPARGRGQYSGPAHTRESGLHTPDCSPGVVIPNVTVLGSKPRGLGEPGSKRGSSPSIDEHPTSHNTIAVKKPRVTATGDDAAAADNGTISTKTTSLEYCPHCDNMFSDKQALIAHLYELLPMRESTDNSPEIRDNTMPDHEENITPEGRENTRAEKKGENPGENMTQTQELGENAAQECGQKTSNEGQDRSAVEETCEPPRGEAAGESKLTGRSYNRYRCVVCEVTLTGLHGAERHRRTHHPGQRHVIRRLHPRNISKPSDCGELRRLVPTSLFRCPSCKVCFVSADIAAAHKCSHDATYHCYYCHRLIASADKTEHQKQHKMKIKLQPLEDIQTSRYRIIRECPYCDVCFRNDHFNSHFPMCGKILKKKCEECSALIPSSEYRDHLRAHEDIFRIQYVIDTTVSNIQQLSANNTSSGQSSTPLLKPSTNVGKRLQIFKCKNCTVIVTSLNGKINHKCSSKKDQRTCNICGENYQYTQRKYHHQFHKTYRKFTKKYMTNIEQFEPGNSNVQRKCEDESLRREEADSTCGSEPSEHFAFHCLKCNLTTDTYDSAIEHSIMHRTTMIKNTKKCVKCKFNYIPAVCDKTMCVMCIHGDTYMLYYEPSNAFSNGCNPDLFEWPDSIKEEKEKYFVLLKKTSIYNEVTNVKLSLIKNGNAKFTIYKCSICHVAVDKNNIVHHWKSKCALTDRYSCEACDIPFDSESAYIDHQSRHDTNEDFRILQFTGPVFEVAVPKYKVFTCAQCSCSELDENCRDNHTCIRRRDRVTCGLCGMTYDKFWEAYHNESVHLLNPGLERKNVTHASFNMSTLDTLRDDESDDSDGSLYSDDSNKSDTTFSDSSSNIENPSNTLRVFKCKNCSVIIFRKSSTHRHKCVSHNLQRHCEICKENIACQQMAAHKNMHDRFKDRLEPGHFNCKLFESKNKLRQSSKKENTVSRIDTPDTSTDYTTNTESAKKEDAEAETRKHIIKGRGDKCQKDKNKTDTDKRNNISQEDEQTPTPSVTSGRTDLLFKCVPCNVFFISQHCCEIHMKNHKVLAEIDYINCKFCSLQFRVEDLGKHVRYNHSEEFDPECVLVQEFTPRRDGSPQRRVARLVLPDTNYVSGRSS